MRLVLVALAACSGTAAHRPKPPTPQVSWQVTIRVPPQLKFNMETIDGALADPGERPELFFREGLHASTRAAEAMLEFGPVPTSTRIVSADNRGAWKLTRANGREIQVELGVVPATAQWFDVNGKLVAVSGATTFAEVGDDGTIVWSQRVIAVGESVTFLGTSHGRALFQLRAPSGSSVVAVDFSTRTASVALQGQAGRGVLADRANQLALVSRDRFEVFELATGKRLRDVALPPLSERTGYSEDADLGFDGATLWSYVYVPPANGSIVISHQSCGYDAFDATSGRLLRTLAHATGDWKRLTESCGVRALLAQPDGVIVVRVQGPSSSLVVKLDGVP